MKAVQNGWTVDALAEASYGRERNPTPAFVVTNVRHLCEHPPVATAARPGWVYGHTDCREHEGCEICHCLPGQRIHHKPQPTPPAEWAQGRMRVWGMGRL